jgi:hypothetical protein
MIPSALPRMLCRKQYRPPIQPRSIGDRTMSITRAIMNEDPIESRNAEDFEAAAV